MIEFSAQSLSEPLKPAPTERRQQIEVVGQRLKTLRTSRGLTQSELARATGVSRSLVAQWETGRSGCDGRAEQIAQALDVPAYELRSSANASQMRRTPLDDDNEVRLVEKYRALNHLDKICLLRIADALGNPRGSDLK